MITTGLKQIDDAIGGINRSDLVVICDKHDVGITPLALNITANVAIRDKKHVVFFTSGLGAPLEQLICMKGGIDSRRIYSGMANSEMSKIQNAIVMLHHAKITFVQEPFVQSIVVSEKVAELFEDECEKPDLIVVQYLDLMGDLKNTLIMLKSIALSRGIPVIAVKIHGESDKEKQDIISIADVVFSINLYDEDSKELHIEIINQQMEDFYVLLDWDKNMHSIKDYTDPIHDEGEYNPPPYEGEAPGITRLILSNVNMDDAPDQDAEQVEAHSEEREDLEECEGIPAREAMTLWNSHTDQVLVVRHPAKHGQYREYAMSGLAAFSFVKEMSDEDLLLWLYQHALELMWKFDVDPKAVDREFMKINEYRDNYFHCVGLGVPYKRKDGIKCES